jgi:PKD repeat protein
MKTIAPLLKSIVLLIAVGFATRASAQCQAGFTYSVNGGTISFTNTSTFASWAQYSWNFGDNTADYSVNPTHTYNSAGTYYVCLTLIDSLNSCQSTFCDSVVATVGCGMNVNATVTNPSNCNMSDGAVSLSVTGGTTPYTYLWSNAANTSSLSSLSAGYYNYTVTDANNCIVTGSANLSCAIIDSCNANFSWSANGNTAWFNNTTGSDSATAVFTWNFGDNTSYTGANPWTHTYAQPGTYWVYLTVTDATWNCAGAFGDSVTVGGPVSCGVSFNMMQDSFNLLQWYAYSSISGQAPFTYLWDFGDNSTSTLASPTHNYAVAGQYTVCLSITDANGCSSMYCDSSSVHRMSSAAQMQYFTANPTLAGVHEQAASQMHTWPNPTSDFINITLTEDVDGTVQITDLLGNVVLEQKVNGRQMKVDVNSLPAGYYNMTLTGGTAKWNEKIVIIR